MQYSQITSYLFCKWQYEYYNKKAGCGCDTILADLGKDIAEQDEPATDIKVTRSVEYFPELIVSLVESNSIIVNKRYANYYSEIPEAPSYSIFHPPLA